MAGDKKIVMLSTSERGGIASVVDSYERDGLFKRWGIHLVITHVEGSLRARLMRAATALGHVFVLAMNGRISLLHCHVSMYGSFWRKSLFAVMGRMFGIPVLLHLHGSKTKEFYRDLPPFAKRMVERQLAAAEAILVLSDSWRAFVLGLAPNARVVVLPNYVDIPVYGSIGTHSMHESGSAEARGDRINVLFLGMIGERKGVYDLLRAFAAAASGMPGLYLRLAGNGEVGKARKFAERLGLQREVEFLGWVDAEARNGLLADTDVFVLPSYNEGLPVSVLEAMAWGIPVITTPVGGIPELIKSHINGILIPPGDLTALQEAIERLGKDAEIRRRMGLAGRNAVRLRFSRENTLPKLEALYAEHMSVPSGLAPQSPDVK